MASPHSREALLICTVCIYQDPRTLEPFRDGGMRGTEGRIYPFNKCGVAAGNVDLVLEPHLWSIELAVGSLESFECMVLRHSFVWGICFFNSKALYICIF